MFICDVLSDSHCSNTVCCRQSFHSIILKIYRIPPASMYIFISTYFKTLDCVQNKGLHCSTRNVKLDTRCKIVNLFVCLWVCIGRLITTVEVVDFRHFEAVAF